MHATSIRQGIRIISLGASLVLFHGLCSLTSAATNTLEKGLVLYWTFDEGKTNMVKDISGLNNAGMVGGKVEWAPGIKGQAVKFDGKPIGAISWEDAFCNPGPPAQALTVAFWIYPIQWAGGYTIVNKGWSYGWGIDPHFWGAQIHFCANIGGRRDIGVRGAKGEDEIPLNQWSHVAVTYDGTFVCIYTNGVQKLKTSVDEGGRSLQGGINHIGEIFQIGRMSAEGKACLDEVKLYDRALSAEEIKACFESLKDGMKKSTNNNQ